MIEPIITVHQPDETLIHGHKTFTFDLRESKAALARINEIKTVTPTTYPELIGTFTAGFYELSKAVSHVRAELVYIEHELEVMRAHLLTDADKVPKWIADQGLKNTQDNTNALIMKNQGYSDLYLVREEFKAKVDELESIMRIFNSTLYSLKEISHQRTSSNYRANHDLSIPDGASAGMTSRRNYGNGEF